MLAQQGRLRYIVSHRHEDDGKGLRPGHGLVTDSRVTVLREGLRHYQAWRSVYEAEGLEMLHCPDGTTWSIWDVDYLLHEGLPLLPKRQREAIWYCLIVGMREED